MLAICVVVAAGAVAVISNKGVTQEYFPIKGKAAPASALQDKNSRVAASANRNNKWRTNDHSLAQDWQLKFVHANDRFEFVAEASRAALAGDGRAAIYVAKAIQDCSYAIQLAKKGLDPAAPATKDSAALDTTPAWVVELQNRRNARCLRLAKEDPFAALPADGGDYYSARRWFDVALKANDPIAIGGSGSEDLYKAVQEKSPVAQQSLLDAAQSAFDQAIWSGDPTALFQVGKTLSEGHFSNDQDRAFAISLAACSLGYDCTSANPENDFSDCQYNGMCPTGSDYGSLLQHDLGADRYAKIYALAEQFKIALTAGDTGTVDLFSKAAIR